MIEEVQKNKSKFDSNNKVMTLSSGLPHLQDSQYAKHLNHGSKYLNIEPKKRGRSRSKSFGEGSAGVEELQRAEQRGNSTDDDMPQEVDDSPARINRVDAYNHIEMPKPLDSRQTQESGRTAEQSD